MSNLLARLLVAVDADIASYKGGMAEAQKVAEKRSAGIQKAVSRSSAVIVSALGAAAAASVAMVVSMSRDAAKVSRLGAELRMTAEDLSGLRFAAKQTGVEFAGLESGLRELLKSTDRARAGIGKGADAFDAMGLSAKRSDGSLKSQSELLSEIAGRFAGYRDGAHKSALAQALFGSHAQKMLPLLNQGAGGIAEMTDQAERLGMVLSTDAALAAEQLQRSLGVMRSSAEGVAYQFMQALTPGVAALSVEFANASEQGDGFKAVGDGLAQTMKVIIAGAYLAAQAVQTVVGTTLEAGAMMERGIQRQANSVARAWLWAAEQAAGSTGLGAVIGGQIDELRAKLDAGSAEIAKGGVQFGSEFRASVDDMSRALSALFDPLEQAAAGAGVLADQSGKVNAPIMATSQSLRDQARALRELEAAQRDADRLYADLLRIFDPLQAAMNDYAEVLQQVDGFEAAGVLTGERLIRVREMLQREYLDNIDAIQSMRTPAQQLIEAMDEEIRLLRMGNFERNVELALRGAAVGMNAEQIRSLRQMVTARQAEIEALQVANAAAEEAERRQMQLATTISESLADALVGGARGFSNFARQMRDMARRMVADMIAQFLRLRVIGPILAGLTGSSAAMAGGGGGGGFASLLGASGGGGFGGLMGGISGGIGSLLSGAGGFLSQGAAFQGAGLLGSVGNFGGGLATAGANIGGAGFFGSMGANLSQGFAAIGSGSIAAGLGQIIPVVGQIYMVLKGIDVITGGRIFGRGFRAEGMTQTLSVGASGGSATLTEQQRRRGSLFGGGSARRDVARDVDPETLQQIEALFDSVRDAMGAAARALGGSVPEVIGGTFQQVFDKEGNLKDEFSALAGVVYKEGSEAFGRRLLAENIAATIDAAMGGFEASDVAVRWRENADVLLDGAQMLLAAAVDIRAGAGLLGDGSLAQVADIVEELSQSGESLVETYQRLSASTAMLRDALELAGYSIDNSAEEVVRYAAALVDAAGSIEEAGRLWARNIDAFVDPVTRAALAYQRAAQDSVTALTGIGLDPDATAAQFHAAFSAALEAGLDPAELVEWLRAGDALASFIEAGAPLQQMLAGMRAELAEIGASDYAGAMESVLSSIQHQLDMAAALGASEDELALIRMYGAAQIQALADAQREAATEYQRFIEDIVLATDVVDPTGYQRAMLDIERATADAVRDANRLAQAAGRQGASERDLAAIHRWAASQARRAIEDLRDATSSLIQQLGYGQLQEIERQIEHARAAAEDAGSGMVSAFDAAGSAGEDTASRWMRAVQAVGDWLDSILLSDLSTLTPEQRLGEAQAQFDDLLQRALGGDAMAAGELAGAATALLTEARGFFGSNDDYQRIFDMTREAMAGVLAMAGPLSAAGGGGPGFVGGMVEVESPQLVALIAERDAIMAQQDAANRLALAAQLAEHLAMLAAALGTPVVEMAAAMGVSMEQLARDLGIDLQEANADVVQQLAAMALMLGTDLGTLADAVGLALGDLADSQSLLNAALGQEIDGLPSEHAEALRPMLRAIEEASTPEAQIAAIEALELATMALPDEYRDALAPYLAGVDPILQDIRSELMAIDELRDTALEQLAAMESVAADMRTLTLAIVEPTERAANAAEEIVQPIRDAGEGIGAIREMIKAQNQNQGLGIFHNGTDRVPRTGLYGLARNEAVLSAPEADFFRRGEHLDMGSPAHLDARQVELLAEIVGRLDRVENAVTSSGDKVAAAASSDEPGSVYRTHYDAAGWR